MSDIKLFRVGSTGVSELAGQSVAVEKSLQTLIERNLEALLGVRMLASEYSTGKVHGGRIDSLGLDENGFPVIIEYKRALNENVINQGLFYLDWLLDHRAELYVLVQKTLGPQAAEKIEWSNPRLLCIAGDFTKYDQHAVQQINRSIELIRYRRYGDELLMLELVNAASPVATATPTPTEEPGPAIVPTSPAAYKTVTEMLEQASPALKDRFESLKAFLLALGDDVQLKVLKYYFAFKRIRNFVCVEVAPQAGRLNLYLKLDPLSLPLEPGFTRDVRNIGHWGTGDLEVVIKSDADLERARPLLVKSYEAS